MLRNWGAAWAFVGLLAVPIVGFSFFDRPHCYEDAQACVSQQRHGTENDYFPSFVAIGSWATLNRDAIDALAAIGSLVFAGALVLATVSLARKTSGLYQETAALRAIADQQRADLARSIKAAEDTASAALLQAEAMMDSERAHLFVVIKADSLKESLRAAIWYPNTPSMEDAYISSRPTIEFVVKNLGRTSAIMTEVSYQLIQGPENQSSWELAVSNPIVDPVIEGGKETFPQTPCQIESLFRVRDARDAMEGDRPLYFYGRVVFRDTFNLEHTYYWRYQNEGLRFILVNQQEFSKNV